MQILCMHIVFLKSVASCLTVGAVLFAQRFNCHTDFHFSEWNCDVDWRRKNVNVVGDVDTKSSVNTQYAFAST